MLILRSLLRGDVGEAARITAGAGLLTRHLSFLFIPIVGPGSLSLVRVHDPVARCLAVGTMSHAIGPAATLQAGETRSAMPGVAFSIKAVLTALIALFLVPWLSAFGASP